MRKLKNHSKAASLFSLLLFVCSSCIRSSKYSDIPRITAGGPTQVFIAAASEPPPEYHISPGDSLDIDIYRRSDLQSEISIKKAVVGPDGTVSIPLAGKIQVQNLTTSQLSTEISQALSDYFSAPIVNVNFSEALGQQVGVLGEVKTPGNYDVGTGTTALEAILLAGGFTDEAETSEVILVRTEPKTKETNQDGQVAALNLQDLLEKADVRQNVVLRRGDILLVPPNPRAERARFSKTIDDIILPLLSVATVISTIIILGNSGGSGG